MGFTKLDEGIIYSSLMGEDDAVFRVWIILLATCKQNGISPISEIFISKITGKDINEIIRCLKILESPDGLSRSKNDSGCRLKRIDGGFEIINYQKYRADTARDYLREKQRNFRKKAKCIDTVSIPSASASSSASKEVKEYKNKELCPFFLEFWALYPRKDTKSEAFGVWIKKNLKVEIEKIKAALVWQVKSEQWTEAGGKYIPQARTYLNKRRWEDEPNKTSHIKKLEVEF